MICRKAGAWFALGSTLVLRLAAHDYWFEPSRLFAAAGDRRTVRLTFENQPLPRAKAFAETRDTNGTVHSQALVTDENGDASFPLAQPGLWLVRLVHMQRAPAGDAEADWESFWAACTFGVK